MRNTGQLCRAQAEGEGFGRVYCDGVRIGGLYGSKAAAFEAATVAASFAVQEGSGVQVNVPDAPGSNEIPSEWIAAMK